MKPTDVPVQNPKTGAIFNDYKDHRGEILSSDSHMLKEIAYIVALHGCEFLLLFP